MRTTTTVLLALGTLALAACGEATRPDTSEVKHDLGHPVRGTETWMWANVSDQEYVDVIGKLLGIKGTDLLPNDHALTKRVQYWLDQLDGEIRAAHPTELAGVPKPKAKVLKQPSANAFVSPVPVCYTLPVKVRGGTATASNTADAVYLDLATGELSSFPLNQYKCLTGSNASATVKAVVQKLNSGALNGCRMTVSSSGTLSANDSCPLNGDIDGVVAAKKLVIMQTANYVTVHTAIFPMMSEQAIVSVLSHELGHYYRSHINATESDYDFFYTLKQNQPDHRPAAEADKKELGEGAVLGSTLLNGTDMHRAVAGQKLRPELYFAAGSLVLKVAAKNGAPQQCKDAATLLEDDDFVEKTGTYPYGRSLDGEAAAVTDFDTKVLACLAKLQVSSTPGTLTATKVSWDQVKDLVEGPVWPAWLGELSPRTLRTIAKMVQLTSLRLGADAPASSDVKTMLVKASEAMTAQDDSSVNFLKRAHDEHLGQYTIEQEADEEGVEWLSALGIDPKHAVDSMHRLGKGSETGLRGFELGETDCDALWSNGWRTQDGAYAFVPIGDFSEIHHSVCYRMFNLEREVKAHDHEAANVQPALLSAAKWQDLQTSAGGLSSPVEGGGGLFTLAPIAKKWNVLACPYAAGAFE